MQAEGDAVAAAMWRVFRKGDAAVICEAVLTANAGVLLHIGGFRAAVDALHSERRNGGWSVVSDETLRRVWDFFGPEGPDLVLATHGHNDHFSPALWDEAQVRWPKAVFAAPCGGGRTMLLTRPMHRFRLPGAAVEAARLPHDGKMYEDTVQYGFRLSVGGFDVLLPGDCALGAEALEKWTGGRKTNLAVMNFPWLTHRKGREFLENTLKPERLLLCHLPFAEDDANGYRDIAFAAMKKPISVPDVRCLSEPMQRETYLI